MADTSIPLHRVQTVEMRGIVKRFPGVLANDRVDFDLAAGEIHGLLGENGAGKTTLMNMLYGLYHPDAGQIFMHGQPVSLHNPNEAVRRGIGMVHQHFMLIPVFTRQAARARPVCGIRPTRTSPVADCRMRHPSL